MRFRVGLTSFLILRFWLPASSAEQAAVNESVLQSITAAQRVLAAAPDSEANRTALASLYLRVDQSSNAVRTLQPYVEAHPNAPNALRLLAAAYLRENEYAEAKDAATRALRAGDRDSATVEMLGMAELGLGAADAEGLLREAVKLDPQSAEANLQLGLLYSKQHRNLEEAIGLLQKAAALQPKTAGTRSAIGSAYLEKGDARRAAESLETAVKLDASIAEPYYLLASAYSQLGDTEKASAALSAFQERKRAEADQRASEMHSRADYEAGVDLLSNTDQLDRAYDLLSKAAQELPTFDAAYYRMAQVSYLKDDLRAALTSIRIALRLNPLEPEYYYVLARCLEDSDPGAAIEAVKKAIGLRPAVPDFQDLLKELKSKAGKTAQ